MASKQKTRKTGVRAVVYCRISSDGTGEDAGTTRQKDDCLKLVKAKGWTLVGEPFIDNSISASKYARKKRPAFTEMMRLVEAGEVDAIVCWHIDRLYRQPKELEALIDLAAEGRLRVAAKQGDIDLSTDNGQLMARVLVSVGAMSTADTHRRVKRAREAQAANGTSGGGPRPFGYDRTRDSDGVPDGTGRLVIVAAEARAIRDGVKRLLAGGSQSEVARRWNEAGLRTPQKAAQWNASKIRSVLSKPSLAGLRVHDGEVVGTAGWKAIITREQHEQLVSLFAERVRNGDNPRSSNPWAGLLRCASCKERMTREALRGTYRFRCHRLPGNRNCGRISIVTEQTTALVLETMFALNDKNGLPVRTQVPTDGDAAELEHVEEKMAELADDYASDLITRAEWLKMRTRLEARRDQARAAVSRTSRSAALDRFAEPGSLRRAWPRLSPDEQRGVLRAAIDRVEIDPQPDDVANRIWVPGRVHVEWRG